MTNIKLLEISEKAYKEYRRTVKDAENESYDQIRRKLTRNMLLGKELKGRNGERKLQYGRLKFSIKNNKIIWLRNFCSDKDLNWSLDIRKYVELNKELGIDDNRTYTEVKIQKMKNGIKRKYKQVKWKLLNGNKNQEVTE